jgi:adenosylcobinamide-phosphate guanylyltransferase
MDALVMAGGRGERMGGCEKPMLLLRDRPLVSYVLEALLKSSAIDSVYVAVSPNTPQTSCYIENWPDKKVSPIMTPGAGYVEDMGLAIRAIGKKEPILVVSADMPLITPGLIDKAISEYHRCGKEALSVWIEGLGTPAGINVVHGAYIDRAQEELILVLNDPALAANVNYRKDLTYCEQIFDGKNG